MNIQEMLTGKPGGVVELSAEVSPNEGWRARYKSHDGKSLTCVSATTPEDAIRAAFVQGRKDEAESGRVA